MHHFHPYIDLRQNTEQAEVRESIWPSFTDIMAVVLMIFMFAMIVVILRSSDLADRLKKVQETLQKSQEERAVLETETTAVEEELRKKEMEIILLGEENRVTKSTLEGKLAIITALESDLDLLRSRVNTLEEDVAEKESLLALERKEREEEIAGVRERYEQEQVKMTREMEEKIDEFNRKFAALSQIINEKEDLILVMRRKGQDIELALAKQRKDYTVLEEKYHKLIKPARSPVGKTVVSVNYSRVGERYRIFFKGVGAAEYQEIRREELHKRLGKLKEQLRAKLYVKIVIPEDSNLSYNEAWTFTQEILSRYDYYYSDLK